MSGQRRALYKQIDQNKRFDSIVDGAPAPGDSAITGDVLVVRGDWVTVVPQTGASDGDVLTLDSGSDWGVSWQPGGGGGGGGGAPTNATYVTLSLNGTLTNERVLQTTGTGLGLTDNGANSTVDLFLDADLQALAGVGGTGLLVRTGAGTATTRTITIDAGSTAYLAVANGSGVAGDPTLSVDPYAILDLMVDERFGDGSDGALTLTGNIALSRDMQYTTLNLAGFAIDANAFRIRCSVELKDTVGGGIIQRNGGAPSGNTGGNAGAVGSLGTGSNGAAASAVGAVGVAGSNNTNVWAATHFNNITASRGGAGGVGSTALAGANGGSVTATAAINGYGGWTMWDTGTAPSSAGTKLAGGSGGGSGGGAPGVRSGPGGAGGSVVMVYAFFVDCPATTKIQANGGAGGANGAGTGGGGGGGGGTAALIYAMSASLPTVEALGGAGGAGSGGGANGSAGAAGYAVAKRIRV
jgi:hypothetical protein